MPELLDYMGWILIWCVGVICCIFAFGNGIVNQHTNKDIFWNLTSKFSLVLGIGLLIVSGIFNPF